MSAAEYRKQFVETVEEPENPYPVSIHSKKGTEIIEKSSKLGELGVMKTGFRVVQTSKVPQPTEHEIQSAILDRLGLLSGAFFWRENSGLMQVGEENKKRFFRAGTPGIPDIMGVYKGRPVGIEVKRPGKKQSIDQRAFQERFDKVGGIYIVCTDATQVVSQILTAIDVRSSK